MRRSGRGGRFRATDLTDARYRYVVEIRFEARFLLECSGQNVEMVLFEVGYSAANPADQMVVAVTATSPLEKGVANAEIRLADQTHLFG
jgi:hypothetical protein